MSISPVFPPSVRILLKNWKLALIANTSLAVALALGIVGFGMFDAIMLRPPFAHDPAKLVSIFTVPKPDTHNGISYPDWVYFRDHNTVFSSVAGLPYSVSKDAVSIGDRAFLASVNAISDNYFETMGLHAEIGQLFKASDGARKEKIAVLTFTEWQRLGGNPNIIGQIVTIDHIPLRIIGVVERRFTSPIFGFATDFLKLMETNNSAERLADRQDRWVGLIGRLKPGVTREQARVEAESMWRQLASAYPKEEDDVPIAVLPTTILHPDILPQAKLISAILLLIMGLILIVACSNVANLLLAIAASRAQETLIKSALGATRGRIIRDFLAESLILSAASGALGFTLAWAALRRISRFSMDVPAFGSFEFAHDLHIDPAIAAFTAGLILLAAIASGLVPAMHSSMPKISAALSGELAIGGTKKGLIRNTIVALQVTVCTVVMIGAGLCWRSLSNLRNVDPGYSARNLVTVMLMGEDENIPEAKRAEVYRDYRRASLDLYGVEAASLTVGTEFGGDAAHTEVRIPQDAPPPAKVSDKIQMPFNIIDEHYLATLGMKLLDGREFSAADREKSPEVALVNQKMAEKYWPGESPLGKKVRMPDWNRVATVVGVVANGKYGDLDQPIHPFMYFALAQHEQDYQVLVVRTKGDPKNWVEPMAQLARQHGLKLYFEPQTLETWTNLSLFVPIITLRCVAFLSAIALLLAAIGLYGTIYYSVSERRREIGIRVALGAMPRQLFSMVVRRSSIIAGIGVASGTVLGVAATILLQSQFFGISPLEWHVLAPVSVAMILLAATIAVAAARPWINMNPMEAIRHT